MCGVTVSIGTISTLEVSPNPPNGVEGRRGSTLGTANPHSLHFFFSAPVLAPINGLETVSTIATALVHSELELLQLYLGLSKTERDRLQLIQNALVLAEYVVSNTKRHEHTTHTYQSLIDYIQEQITYKIV